MSLPVRHADGNEQGKFMVLEVIQEALGQDIGFMGQQNIKICKATHETAQEMSIDRKETSSKDRSGVLQCFKVGKTKI